MGNFISYYFEHSEGRVNLDPETQGKSIAYEIFIFNVFTKYNHFARILRTESLLAALVSLS